MDGQTSRRVDTYTDRSLDKPTDSRTHKVLYQFLHALRQYIADMFASLLIIRDAWCSNIGPGAGWPHGFSSVPARNCAGSALN
jgi:hypothetical protein